MPRILAVDFGERRIGLATSDASASLATPRQALLRRSDERTVGDLEVFCRDEEIGLVVFGIPRTPSGVESPFAGRVRSFAAKFAARSGLPVRFHEETLTSNEAARRLACTARRGARTARREQLDPMAAAVLLEDYLQSVASEAP